MYQFIRNMWIFGKVTEEKINTYIQKGFITQEEADQILATPRTIE